MPSPRDIRQHSSDDMAGVGEFEDTTAPVAVVPRPRHPQHGLGPGAADHDRSAGQINRADVAGRPGEVPHPRTDADLGALVFDVTGLPDPV